MLQFRLRRYVNSCQVVWYRVSTTIKLLNADLHGSCAMYQSRNALPPCKRNPRPQCARQSKLCYPVNHLPFHRKQCIWVVRKWRCPWCTLSKGRDRNLFLRSSHKKIHYQYSFAVFINLIRKYQTEFVLKYLEKAQITAKTQQLLFASPLAGNPILAPKFVDKKVAIKCFKWFSSPLINTLTWILNGVSGKKNC